MLDPLPVLIAEPIQGQMKFVGFFVGTYKYGLGCADCRGLICGIIMRVYLLSEELGPEPRKFLLEFSSLGPPTVCSLSRYRARGHIDRSFALAIQNACR
jgi:hypothetical protein